MVNRKRTVRWHRLLTIPWLLAGVVSWQAGRSERQGHAGEGLFRDVTDQSGIDFVHEDGATGQQFLVEFMGAGVASLDYDLDGLMDVYFCNGHPLQSGEVAGQSIPGNAMFRNISRSGLAFSRVSAMSRADVRAYSLGVTAADYDNDGFPDLAISNYGKNTLLHNNGDGTFTEVTGTAGIDDEQRFSAGINFADVDGDGDLDLFIANYVDFTLERHREVAPGAFPYPPGPKDFPHLADSLYVNQGDGTFRNASRESGIGLVAGPSMGSIAGDFDRDGDVDLFVCCDGMPNHLFENDGSGRFVESAFVWGVALDATGAANGSMGVDAADLNGDGYDDFLVTDYTRQWPMLFLSLDRGVYEDAARRTQIGAMVAPHVNWTAALFDVDNDGDLDALICNGHFLRQAKQLEPGTDFAVEDVVMIDQGGLRFAPGRFLEEEGAMVGSSRGAACEDFDLDGDVDVIVLQCGARARVLENRTAPDRRSIGIDLIGTWVNRSAVGARVTLRHGPWVYSTEVRSGRGYQSHFGSRLSIGLGDASMPDRIEVHWGDGRYSSWSSADLPQQMVQPGNVLRLVQPVEVE